MSVAKLSSSSTQNEMKPADRIDPFEIFMQHAAQRIDSPVQWVPLMYHIGQPEFPGLSFLAPLTVELKKCDKCSKEFCSPMNYRRHILMHRRSLKVDKESRKNRDLLGAFWDKLSLEEAGRVASFDDISLEGVSGSLIVDAWASSVHKPGVLVLPQLYLKAGTILLEIIQAKSSRLSVSAQDLFSILDETSETTFLCAGTAESVQKFMIDGGAKKALELRNLIASTSLLFEQNLVKAWLADKEAEALRCQKILVEEEEVAQKRQSQTLEKKRRKSLRQKEQKVRGKPTGEKTDNNVGEKTNNNAGAKTEGEAESSNSNTDFVEGSANLKSSLEQMNISGEENEEFVEAKCDYSSAHVDSIKSVGSHKEMETDGLYQSTISTWKVVPKSYRRRQVAFLGSQNPQAFKLKSLQKQDPLNEMNNVVYGGEVSARKSKIAIDEEGSRTTMQNVAAKSEIDVESARTTWRNVVANSAIAVESSRAILQNIVAKGADGVESSRTTFENIVAKSENDVEGSKACWKNVVSKGADGLESSRTTLQNVVVISENDVEGSKACWKNIVSKGADGVESSRTTLQNVVAISENDVEGSKACWKNVVSKGADGVESSRTTLQNVVAISENDVEGSKACWKNVVSKGADGVKSSRTTLQNVVAISENDVEGSRTSWKNIVAKGADGVKSPRTTLQNVVAKGAYGVERSKATWKTIVEKAAVGMECSRITLQNVVAISENDVESSRTTFQDIDAKTGDGAESSKTSLNKVVASYRDTSNNKVLAGSLSVPMKNSTAGKHASQGTSTDSSDKLSDSDLVGQDPAVAMSRDVCVYEMRGNLPVQMGNQNSGENARLSVTSLQQYVPKPNDIINSIKMRGNLPVQRSNQNSGENTRLSVTSPQQYVPKPNDIINSIKNSYGERNVQPEGPVFFSFDARAFLAQRWNDTITSNHVKLVLSPEPPCDTDGSKDCSPPVQISGCHHYSDLGEAETPVSSPKKIEKANSKKEQKGKGTTMMKYSQ